MTDKESDWFDSIDEMDIVMDYITGNPLDFIEVDEIISLKPPKIYPPK